ncbi:alpha/beta hydrolase [Paenarthrobacter nitroguajacolicus]|uniref:alpha/beta hydrolase n=1 Tax=Paenarthrobacter nitroguajacolicus TaxID=211146 RepID=UPI00248B832C|nr:alpha/beta hydrolase [Paenarthrobacter nitroguajacolicus]MDI2033696.1 hypothetical protein [Paenarthrobacter nitroguajacolicus]
MTSDPEGASASGTRTPLLYWASVVCAAALILAPAWMLLGNPAVLGGHPLLPALLAVAVVVGILWAVRLWRRRHATLRRSTLRAIGAWFGRVVALALVAVLVWLNPFAYQPPEARAYVDILKPAADAGFLVVILKEPLNLSLLDGNQAGGAIAAHPDVAIWAVGGHSLGGVSASSFALGNSDVDGLLLYASYPLDSLRERAGLKVVSISGTKDGLSTPAKIDASRELLPDDATYVAVQGGNHAFFGSYGPQPGDGSPEVGREVAQAEISDATVGFLRQLQER